MGSPWLKPFASSPAIEPPYGGMRPGSESSGLREAIVAHDNAFLYDWLMEAFSFQGISDANALSYIEAHGNADWMEINYHLQANPPGCPKLTTFDAYKGCGYRKLSQTCNVPEWFGTCVVPRLPLRKGDLNQLALGLFLFIRDVCKGDLVNLIDTTLAAARLGSSGEFKPAGRQGLIKAFKPIFGIGPKLISMSLASVLIAGGRSRPSWVKVGRSMIVVDSLVHNFMHRSGILGAYDKPHAYGPACYGPNGCEAVLRHIAANIDLKAIDPRLPSHHPRLVQAAIWRFCAEGQLEICNGRKIDDHRPCQRLDCPVGDRCSRRTLFPAKDETGSPQPGTVAEPAVVTNDVQEEPDGGTRGRGWGASTRGKSVAKRPRLQGNRDCLCGFYTIINGLRLALEPVGGLSSQFRGKNLEPFDQTRRSEMEICKPLSRWHNHPPGDQPRPCRC